MGIRAGLSSRDGLAKDSVLLAANIYFISFPEPLLVKVLEKK